MRVSLAHLDRVAGVLLGQACGDAIGDHYEVGPTTGSVRSWASAHEFVILGEMIRTLIGYARF